MFKFMLETQHASLKSELGHNLNGVTAVVANLSAGTPGFSKRRKPLRVPGQALQIPPEVVIESPLSDRRSRYVGI